MDHVKNFKPASMLVIERMESGDISADEGMREIERLSFLTEHAIAEKEKVAEALEVFAHQIQSERKSLDDAFGEDFVFISK